jgi:hypothetical protein
MNKDDCRIVLQPVNVVSIICEASVIAWESEDRSDMVDFNYGNLSTKCPATNNTIISFFLYYRCFRIPYMHLKRVDFHMLMMQKMFGDLARYMLVCKKLYLYLKPFKGELLTLFSVIAGWGILNEHIPRDSPARNVEYPSSYKKLIKQQSIYFLLT